MSAIAKRNEALQEGNAMYSVHPHLLFDLARERQRELLAEAERNSLAKEARLSSQKARPPQRVTRPRWALVGAMRSAVAHLL